MAPETAGSAGQDRTPTTAAQVCAVEGCDRPGVVRALMPMWVDQPLEDECFLCQEHDEGLAVLD